MCMSCTCNEPMEKHDAAAIDWADLQAAAKDAGVSPEAAAENIRSKVALMVTKAAEFEDFASNIGLQVFKSVDEQRYTLGVAYAANHPDVGRAQDGFRDFVGAEALEKAAWRYMRNGANVGLDHMDGTEGTGRVVESYIYRGPDWPQDNGYVVKAGDWLLGIVWPEPAWQAIKSRRRRGLSMQGGARRRRPSAAALARLR